MNTPRLHLAWILILAACGGGGGGGVGDRLEVVSSNVAVGQQGWEINRPLRVTFDEPVDPASVDNNTFNVRLVGGAPAFGTVELDPADSKSVLWRPDCPTLDDLSDAGLAFGLDPNTGAAHLFELAVIGSDQSAGFTVRSASGRPLERSFFRRFQTPPTQQFQALFVDDAVGPPRPVVRDAGSLEQRATHLLVAGAPHFFERQPSGAIQLAPALDLPLNLHSGGGTDVVLELYLDQSVDMRTSNMNGDLLRWEFEDQPGVWRPLSAVVTLEQNCSGGGAHVRIAPAGLLPPDTALRAVVDAGFGDLVGDTNGIDLVDFAPARARSAPAPLVDHFLEGFGDASHEDSTATFGEPRAVWGGGELAASFSFTGTGGPGGDFDFRVVSGEIVILSTIQAILTGGPGFVPQKQQVAVGGVFDLRNLLIEDGGVLKFEGPNPVTLFVSGELEVRGAIILDGTTSKGVQSTNTTLLPEIGGAGQAGGGLGGTGSFFTNAATPRGGHGSGAFGLASLGGQGGEAGYAQTKLPQSLRRGAGGGGGRLGRDVPQTLGPVATFGEFDQSRLGMDAEPGFDNTSGQFGVSSGAGGPRGGAIGPEPFTNPDPGDDFFGIKRDLATGAVVIGELKKPWAGSGGGAGGDASFVGTNGTYPPKWTIGGDEKGAGGGGGGGSLHVLALGAIRIAGNGRISANGGGGGGGENNNRTNRVGGGSGGGSGGHVILETASVIDLSQVAGFAVSARGGQGGAGENDRGGVYVSNQGPQETSVKGDACPPGYPATGTNTCLGHIDGAGGDGGPGIVQLHTSTGTVGVDILLPPGLALEQISQPPPLSSDGSFVLLPSFGRLSRARSAWIPLGEGGYSGAGLHSDVTFDFAGLDAAGYVERNAAGEVLPRPPLLSALGGVTLGRRFTFAAAPLIGGPDEALLHSTQLIEHHFLQLQDTSQPTRTMRFEVVAAQYDATAVLLTVDLDPNGPPMDAFQSSGPVAVELQPAFFRLRSDGVPDLLPPSSGVRITFEATVADASGAPQTNPVTVPWTPDVSALNFPGNAGLRFFRFEVLLDLDQPLSGLSPTSPIPSLDFLRLPFRYP